MASRRAPQSDRASPRTSTGTRPAVDPSFLLASALPWDQGLLEGGQEGARAIEDRPPTPILLNPELIRLAFSRALAIAAGFDPVRIDVGQPPPVLWDDGVNRLLVHLSDSQVSVSDGTIDVSVGVECDQVGRTKIVTTFVTSLPKRPAGFVFATETRPRGPLEVVQVWGDALVALCWRALVELTAHAATSLGTTAKGQPLVPGTVVATERGIVVVAQAPHPFMTVKALR